MACWLYWLPKRWLPLNQLLFTLNHYSVRWADVKLFVQEHTQEVIGRILATMRLNDSAIGIQRDGIGALLNMAVNGACCKGGDYASVIPHGGLLFADQLILDVIEGRIGSMGGIECILAAMDRFPNSTSLQQLSCHALFHLTFDGTQLGCAVNFTA